MAKQVPVLAAACVLIALLIVLLRVSGGDTPPSTISQPSPGSMSHSYPDRPAGEALSVTESSPPWAKLAALHAQSRQPPRPVLDRFRNAFVKLERYCPDPAERIGDFMVAGQLQLAQRGKLISLLDLTEAVTTMLDTASATGGIPTMASCSEPVSLMVIGLRGR